MIKLTMSDNFQESIKIIEKELSERNELILFACGLEAQGEVVNDMQKNKVWDTGRLAGSISFITTKRQKGGFGGKAGDELSGRTKEKELIIGSNVEYATFVNSGTRYQRARKFLQNGIYTAQPRMNDIAKNIMIGD